ncbi:MAG: peptidase M16 [Legionellales bacterium]|nr:peptidase M16 [Legionellales bacterium]|tara:strand:+ start:7576 stop:8919 length:1344 start_codon:yes stop_codon:yes gene_type:complete
MANKFLTFIILFGLSLSAWGKDEQVLPIQHWTLANGAQVYFVESHELPLVDLNLSFRAGSAYDGRHPGIASYTARMLAQGTKHLSADDIAEKFDNVGAIYSHSTSRDSADISLRSMSDEAYFNPAVATFTDIINHPNFPSTAANRVKQQLLQALKYQQQHPSTVATLAFYHDLYQNNPYGHNPLGNAKQIKNISPHDLARFYKHHYNGANTVVAIVGDLSLAKAKTLSQQLVGRLPKGELASLPPLTMKTTASLQQHIEFPSTQTSVRIGNIAIARSSPDYIPLTVGNHILGGNVLTSRLFAAVREQRGLTYDVASRFSPMQEKGPFMVSMQTRNDKTTEAIAVTKDQIKQFVQQGPTAKELQSAKQNIIGGFPLSFSSNASITNMISAIGFYELPLDYLDTYRGKVDALSQQDITQAFQQHIDPDKLLTVTVGAAVASQSNTTTNG